VHLFIYCVWLTSYYNGAAGSCNRGCLPKPKVLNSKCEVLPLSSPTPNKCFVTCTEFVLRFYLKVRSDPVILGVAWDAAFIINSWAILRLLTQGPQFEYKTQHRVQMTCVWNLANKTEKCGHISFFNSAPRNHEGRNFHFTFIVHST
jgi:hypothetical protein